ncbi:hypothetical protein HRR95_001065 [Exophiala dermatitidis]|nr:hypothetical protein HRR95_001065 [Exophiala dermatitidis]
MDEDPNQTQNQNVDTAPQNMPLNNQDNRRTDQTITLRRAGVPGILNSNMLGTPWFDFWTGAVDTITLSGVEIVSIENTATETTDHATNTAPEQNQDEIISTEDAGFQIDNGTDATATTTDSSELPQETFQAIGDDDMGFMLYTDEELDSLASELFSNASDLPQERFPQERFPPLSPESLSAVFAHGTSLPARETDESLQCAACLEETLNLILLPCGHQYCRPCLNDLIREGLANRGSFPPRCCTSPLAGAINIASIQKHLDPHLVTRYFSVVEEFSVPDPVYCANPCTDCGAITCVECKQSLQRHVGEDGRTCRENEDLMDAEDRQLANANRWRQCPNCKNLVEKTEGCNHVVCDCGTEFCYGCGGAISTVGPDCDCMDEGEEEPEEEEQAAAPAALPMDPVEAMRAFDAFVDAGDTLRQRLRATIESSDPQLRNAMIRVLRRVEEEETLVRLEMAALAAEEEHSASP